MKKFTFNDETNSVEESLGVTDERMEELMTMIRESKPKHHGKAVEFIVNHDELTDEEKICVVFQIGANTERQRGPRTAMSLEDLLAKLGGGNDEEEEG